MQHTFKKKRRQKSAIKIQCGWTLTGVRREGANIPFCCHTHHPYRRRRAQRNIVNYITTQQRLRQQCELHDGHQRTSTPNISPRYVGEIFDQIQLVSLCFGFTVKLQSKMSI